MILLYVRLGVNTAISILMTQIHTFVPRFAGGVEELLDQHEQALLVKTCKCEKLFLQALNEEWMHIIR